METQWRLTYHTTLTLMISGMFAQLLLKVSNEKAFITEVDPDLRSLSGPWRLDAKFLTFPELSRLCLTLNPNAKHGSVGCL